jgi:hypothetical protein
LKVTNGLTYSFQEDEIPLLRRELGHGIKSGWDERGLARPRLLFAMLQAAARAEHEKPQVRPGDRTAGFGGAPILPASGQPDTWLTTSEAGGLAGCSQSFMCRVVRRGDVDASRGPGGAWRVDISSLNAWIVSRRRKESDRKAA